MPSCVGWVAVRALGPVLILPSFLLRATSRITPALYASVIAPPSRPAYSWAGTGMMVWVLNEAVPAPWIAVSWIILAVALALVMRRIGYRQLGWQANAVAACSLVRAYTFNLGLEQPFWQGISLRLVTISIIAAGLYFLSRQSTPRDSDFRRAVSYVH